MIAVDTNVVVRFLVDDHPVEGNRARRVFEDNRVLLLESVLLETEWVLRAVYDFSREEISRAIRALMALSTVSVDDRMLLLNVLDSYDDGFDYADALHYARSGGLELITFDCKFLNRSKKRNWRVNGPYADLQPDSRAPSTVVPHRRR
ncbi:MAG: type II toxin-antitoxin system VapC family toxin [Verrucomicrobiales bacterium]